MEGLARARPILVLLLAAFLFGLNASASAQTLESAIRQFQAGEIKKAVNDWEMLARGGDENALFNLGQVFRLGAGGDADASRAVGYYQRAADLGHTPALRELGRLYAFGPAFAGERGKGVELLREAAHAGDPEAEYLLGAILFAGDLTRRDKIRAYAWVQLAAEGGEGQAIPLRLAMRGELSDNDIAEAFALSRTLITAPYLAASNTLLVGERPVPRRFAEANTEPAPPAGEESPAPVEEHPAMAQGPDVEAPPLELPKTEEKPAHQALANVVGEAEAISAVTDAEGPGVLDAGEPEAAAQEGPDVAPPEEGPAEAGNISPPEDGAGELSAAGEPPAGAEEPQAAPLDLGNPESPLVDAEGFPGAFSIQLASFRTPEKAEEEWQAITREGAELFIGLEKRILRFELGPDLGVRYRLRVGPFADKDAADARCQELTDAGIGCLVIWP